MPTLNWIGKEAVINHHHDVPFRVLDRKYDFGNGDDNMIIHGDNLEALKAGKTGTDEQRRDLKRDAKTARAGGYDRRNNRRHLWR